MADETHPVLCSKCRVSPERGFEHDGQIWASCPVCGQADTIDVIGREIGEYLIEEAFRETARDTSGSGVMSIDSPPQGHYRWIPDTSL